MLCATTLIMLVINRTIRALNAKAEVPSCRGMKMRMENMRLKLQDLKKERMRFGILLRPH